MIVPNIASSNDEATMNEEIMCKRIINIGMIVIFTISFTTFSLLAVPDNKDAMNWFKLGVKAQNLTTKINAYKKAIQLEPEFTEAHYNLGLAYKNSSDYSNAELCFHKAYHAESTTTDNQLKLQIMYELAVTLSINSKDNLSEKILREAIAFTNNNNILAILSLELAKVLYKQGHYENVVSELKQARTLYPVKQSEYNKIIGLAEQQIWLQARYQDAEMLETQEQFPEALVIYRQVHTQAPKYRNVADKIIHLEQAIRQAQQQADTLESLYAQGLKLMSEKNHHAAIPIFEGIIDDNPTHEQAHQQLIIAKEYVNITRLDALENAIVSEIEIIDNPIEPNKPVIVERKKLPRTQQKDNALQETLSQEQRNVLFEKYYGEGMVALDQRQFKVALAAFEKVLAFQPEKRNVQNLVSTIRFKIEQDDPQIAQAAPSAALATTIDSLYQKGLTLLVEEDWEGAVAVFEKLNVLRFNDIGTTSLLQKSREQLQRMNDRHVNRTQRNLYLSGVLLVILFTLLGIIVSRWIILRKNRNDAFDDLIRIRDKEHI